MRAVAVTVSALCVLGLLHTAHPHPQDSLAVPLRQSSPTVNARLDFTINRDTKTCVLDLVDDYPFNRTFSRGQQFQVPEISPCVVFKCRHTGVLLKRKETDCPYGSQCVDSVPASEGRPYFCIKTFVAEPASQWRKGRVFQVFYRLVLGFAATPPVTFISIYDRVNAVCRVGTQTVAVGQTGRMEGVEDCVLMRCTRKGLVYLPHLSGCAMKGTCQTRYTRACTNFTCLRAQLTRRSWGGDLITTVTHTIVNGWMKLNPPSCLYADQNPPLCLSVRQSIKDHPDFDHYRFYEVAELEEVYECRERVCLESGRPGLPLVLHTESGCVSDMIVDLCVALGSVSGQLEYIDLDYRFSQECTMSECQADHSDPVRPITASVVPVGTGCYDYELFDEIDFFPKDYKDYGCQPEGLIKEHNCSAVVCSNGVIHRKPIAGCT